MKKKTINLLLIVPFVFYTGFLFWNILFKYVSPLEVFSGDRYLSRTINLIPFNDIIQGNYNKLDLFGNIILFIPLGIYISILLDKNKTLKNILIILIVSLVFESCQYIFGIGATDITDIITNTFGGVIGIYVYKMLILLFKDGERLKKIIGICSFIMMLIVSLLLIGIIIAN
ncbi:VanZ family protein [Terrisporobacter petrolearius]|uniref:VanZ family protein n=1 Tax=Terrisporobacter petrolearius TaxID=1460447 RepID=UPI003B000270